MDVSAVLRAVMAARGWSQEELAHNLNVGQSAVSHWLRGTRVPGGINMERIREVALQSGVIERAPVTSNQVPLMGRVGAGAQIDVEFEQPPPEGYDVVELPLTYAAPVIAFEVAGDSMLPAYEPGEIIVCLRDQVRATDYYLGQRVVVRTSTGERYVKRLARGRSKGTYDLESWNARTIEDVRIEWVGEIVAALPAGAARRVERRPRAPQRTAARKGA